MAEGLSFQTEMGGGDGVMVEDLNSIVTTEPLYGLHSGGVKAFQDVFESKVDFARDSELPARTTWKAKKVQLGDAAATQSVR